MSSESSTPVLDLLSDESRWTKGWFARTYFRIYVPSESRLAKCWCIDGALQRCGCMTDESILKIEAAIVNLYGFMIPSSVVSGIIWYFNDHPSTTHAMVVAVLREAGV